MISQIPLLFPSLQEHGGFGGGQHGSHGGQHGSVQTLDLRFFHGVDFL